MQNNKFMRPVETNLIETVPVVAPPDFPMK